MDVNPRIIVVAMYGPYDLMYFKGVPVYLAAYRIPPSLVQAVTDVLRGRIKSHGRLPVELPGLNRVGDGL